MKNVDEAITGSPLEQFLDEFSRDRIRVRSYVKGTRIRVPDGILFLTEGALSYSYGDSDGNPYHIITTNAFNSIGELHFYYDLQVFDIFTLEDSTVLEVPGEVYKKMELNETFKVFMLENALANMMEISDKMVKRNTYKLENYLAFIILNDERDGRFFYKSMTSLAGVFNVSRRNLYYAADSLIEQGYILKGKGYFEILKRDALEAML